MSFALILGIALLAASHDDKAGSLAAAERLFECGKYAEAAALYDRYAQSGPEAAPFYRNQGNLHFLAGHLPQAILAFRRFVRLTTINGDVYTNWRDARKMSRTEPGATAWGGRLGLSLWLWPLWLKTALAALVWLIGTAVMFLGLRTRLLWLALGSIVLGWSLSVAIYFQEKGVDQHPFAVVAEDEVTLRQGNGLSFPPTRANGKQVVLHSGTEARIRCERPNGWVQLELPDGRIGWVHRQQVLIDE
jgi:tetratricopeptide (TPR) repeat protein